MSDQAGEDVVGDKRPAGRVEKRYRRTMLSTGFGDVPGKRCEVCGYEAFRWQTACPQGHPLA